MDVLLHEAGAPAGGAVDVDARMAEAVGEHRQRLLRLCQRRLGGDRHLAEDVVQESFLKLGRALAAGHDIANVGAWLRTVAMNGTVDELRRSSSLVLADLPEPAVDAGFGGDGDPELETAWRGLSPRHREVLRLRELEGLRYDEIALAMSTGVSAVETLLFRARAALRREYSRAAAAVASAPTPVALAPVRPSRWAELWQGATGAVRLGEVRLSLLYERLNVVLAAALDRAGELTGGAALAGGLAAGIVGGAPAPMPGLPSVPAAPAVPAAPVVPAVPSVDEPAIDAPATPGAEGPEQPSPSVDDANSVVTGAVDVLLGGTGEVVEEILGATARFR